QFPQRLEVLKRRKRIILARQDGGVWGNDGILAKAALEPQGWNAEIGVLVIQKVVARIEGRFRNAPGRTEPAAMGDLFPDHKIIGLVQNATLALLHDQRRHEIFE